MYAASLLAYKKNKQYITREKTSTRQKQPLFVHLRKIFFISFLFFFSDTRLLEKKNIYLHPRPKAVEKSLPFFDLNFGFFKEAWDR